jgi:hypothetical protein
VENDFVAHLACARSTPDSYFNCGGGDRPKHKSAPMLAVHSLALSFNAPGLVPATQSRARPVVAETKADLEALAKELNPLVGFWDPMGLADGEFWGQSNEATIGFIREAEIKHGRIAMFGFVGFIVHSNNIRWPGDEIAAAVPKDISAPAVWDSIPDVAKWQIIGFIGLMEIWRENKAVLAGEGEKHYMSGGSTQRSPSLTISHPSLVAGSVGTHRLCCLSCPQSQGSSRRSTCCRIRCLSICMTRSPSRNRARRPSRRRGALPRSTTAASR